MTNHNLKIAIEKSLSILPTRLEIVKLKNILNKQELEELEKTIDDHPLTKEIRQEYIKIFEKDVRNNVNPYDEFNKRGADTLFDLFGFECTELVKECTEELQQDPKYKHLNPYEHEEDIVKILTKKMIGKIAMKPDLLSKLLDKVSGVTTSKRQDFDPFRKEEMK